uniref:Uncharacterized protein n=1 Tax=Peronospora matthiolae TaxID=2874970 RepID=A0AAV1T969_9STRA
MDGSYIPPPFPFPDAWPKIFAEQQQQQQQKGRWLTSTTFGQAQWAAGPAVAYTAFAADQERVSVASFDAQQSVDGISEEGEDGAYECVYVLSDEWRERFRSSIRLDQRPNSANKERQMKKKKQKNKKKERTKQQSRAANATTTCSSSRSSDLHDEIQAAKTRALARTWKQRGDVDAAVLGAPMPSRIKALEASLDMAFDDFCDTFQPAVWPHDPF